jgi:uncharacterized membrane protein
MTPLGKVTFFRFFLGLVGNLPFFGGEAMQRYIGWKGVAIILVTGLGLLVLGTTAEAQTLLVRGTPVTINSSPMNYGITIQQGFWNVVGVSSASDWDITHSTATSMSGGNWCDYCLADGNAGTISGNTGTISMWSGSPPATGVHADHPTWLTVTPTAGSSGTYGWLPTDILYFWEVNVQQAGTYNISATFSGTSTNMYWEFFTPQASGTWIDAGQCLISTTIGTPQNNVSLSAGWHCFTVFVNGGPGPAGTVTVSVMPAGSVTPPNYVASSISVVGTTPLTVSPGGTFQATRTISNTGGTAGSTSYSIYLSTDQSITTADTLVYSGTTPSIAAGGADTQTVTCTLPGTIAAGSYYVGLYIAVGNTAVTASQDIGCNFQAQALSVISPPVTVPTTGGTFQATRSIQNAGSSAGTTAYTIYISTDQTITTADLPVFSGTTASIAAGATDTQTVTCTVPNGTAAGNYYAGLYIAAGNTAVTTNQDVIVQAPGVPPGPFNMIAPANGATGTSVNPTYSWTASTNATSYTLQVSTVVTFTTLVINQAGILTTSDTPTFSLASATMHYWRVIAVNSSGQTTATGAPWSFTTGNFSPSADAVSPLNTPVRVEAGGTFQATRTISNNGSSPGSVTYGLYLSQDTVITTSDTLIYTGTTASIAPSGTDTNAVTCTVPTNTTFDTDYYVGLYIAAGNTAVSVQRVHVLPGFTRFDALSVSVTGSTQLLAGSPVEIQVQIQNTGGVAGSCAYNVYLSTDASINTADVELSQEVTGALAADGGSQVQPVTVVIPAGTANGTYFLGVYIVSPNTGMQTAVSNPVSICFPAEARPALGCAGGSSGGGEYFPLLPLALLSVLCLWMRRTAPRFAHKGQRGES